MDGAWLASRVLRDLRKDRQLSQHALARLAHVPQPTISEIEAGRRDPGFTLLSRLVEATGLSLQIGLVPLERYSAVAISRRI